MYVVLQYCPLYMFLYVAATKVVTHFNDKGLTVYRQETQNQNSEHFLRWHQLLRFARIKPILIYEKACSSKKTFQITQVLWVIKRFWKNLIHILIHFQSFGMKYLHDTNISSVRVGREETWWGGDPVEKVYKGL